MCDVTRGLSADVFRLVLGHEFITAQPVLYEIERALALKFRFSSDAVEETLRPTLIARRAGPR